MKSFLIIATSLIAGWASAECSFKTASYLDELNNVSNIKKIDIKVSKSAKFAQNFLKIITSSSENIPPELKKSFKASISVEYKFGKCSFKGKVKQNGDWKDHVSFQNGRPVRSLNVRLEGGNIANAVKFKLLIPKTRNDIAEIFGVSVLKNIGFITPETFKVDVTVNGVESEMLFQEDARKELLERNLRREGPIFEGDESLLWDNGMVLRNDRVSLSRLVNDNWFLKGKSSRYISLHAYKRLQLAYLARVDQKTGDFIQPNNVNSEIFHYYHFVMLALEGSHGLAPHNRKFYYNSFIDDFEPIYYDGDLLGSKIADLNNEVLSFMGSADWKFWSTELQSNSVRDAANYHFNQRSKLNRGASNKAFLSFWQKFTSNLLIIDNIMRKKMKFQGIKPFDTLSYDEFLERAEILIPGTSFISTIVDKGKASYETLSSKGIKQELSAEEVASIIKRNKLGDSRESLVDSNLSPGLEAVTHYSFGEGKLFVSDATSVKINVSSKEVIISQEDSRAWAYFNNVDLDGWKIKFLGLIGNEILDGQRFNSFGFTGCLNFYDTTFNNTDIFVDNGTCEDSLNIVMSRGKLNKITVNNAMADAIDLDFSNLDLLAVRVNKARNDCLDVSGGNYRVSNIDGNNCFDKFMSVGEKSIMSVQNVYAKNALIGISAKDFSEVTVNNGRFEDVETCFEAFQKKEEFGGGKLNIMNFECIGEVKFGTNSAINWISP